MGENCPFCFETEPISGLEGEAAFVRYDRFPVSPGHALIIPRRHVASFFELSDIEQQELLSLANKTKKFLDKKLKPDGYNIGINVGAAAGQTIWHVHIHIIPRFTGDVTNPRGGVRGVIPGKQAY